LRGKSFIGGMKAEIAWKGSKMDEKLVEVEVKGLK
jgi:hypothetical protein